MPQEDPTKELEHSKELGFRYPPERVSKSCMTYMERTVELRDFVGLFFTLVKTSHIIEAQLSPEAKLEILKTEAGIKRFIYNFSDHRQVVNEMMLSRAVESFDLYLLSILREIFVSKPELLKSESKVDVAQLLDIKSREDLILFLTERRLHELAFKPLTDLADFIESRTGLTLFKNSDSFETVLIASEVRNLIAHNDCHENDIFKRRLGKVNHKLDVAKSGKVLLGDEWLRRSSYMLDNVVFNFDEEAVKKFAINSMARQSLSQSSRRVHREE